ncbi:amino acid adenylation domain-containing protein [Streptomyces sp. NPDC056373]|uniref:non-ribosomal peptide synthetase n=1 Tax=Streptomyces sp. NPDC056373 TaxID=3345798 RepID=UPI0035D65284
MAKGHMASGHTAGEPLAGERCHAVRVRLSGPVAVEELTARLAAVGPWRLWVEETAAGSGEPVARRLAATELNRPTQSVRCVLLRHRDDVADLVVVAHRAVLGREGLDRLVDVLVSGAAGPLPVPSAAPVTPPAAAPAPDWGGGRRGDTSWGTRALDLTGSPTATGLLASLALTLHRYAGHGASGEVHVATDRRGALRIEVPADAPASALRPTQPLPTDGTLPTDSSARPDGTVPTDGSARPDGTVPTDSSAQSDTQEPTDSSAQSDTQEPTGGPVQSDTQEPTGGPVPTENPARPGTPARTGTPVLAGLVESAAGEPPFRAGAPAEYLPCLAPPFPLTLALLPQPAGGMRLWASYRRSHFSAGIVETFLRHLAHVLGQFTHAAPDTLVDDIELLDAAERERVALLGRPAGTPPGAPERITDALARVTAATPDAPAVGDGASVLTYRELDEQAGQLARGLVARGIAPGDRVGICLERTTELVVTMLAVLKAGAAYVPTDPAYPADRLAHTARDAGLDLVVTRLAEYPAGAGTPVTPDELTAAAGQPGELPTGGSPDDPAYVIYTSGSTGRPKGVVVPHRNVVALVDATRGDYGLGPDDVWSLFHSGAFDFSVWETWGCLLTGGRLVVVPYLVSREPGEFRDLLVRERVTVLSQTPSAFSQLLETDHAPLVVRLVVFGGEPLDARMLLRWFDRHPEDECRMVNMFGITETTVHVTAQTLTRELALAGSKSVGPALPGWHLYVTDARGRLVPPGVTGEIRVGGAGVALGYLGQSDLTAARFSPDPYAQGRQYHSGDLGRLRPDGTLEHLGRIDSQVKIRGFRIELDEIRSVLLEDPEVHAAAVVVRRDDPADPATARLDAYVVPADLDTAGVRKRAATVLPAYMLPATVTALDALPLTTNGKLDAQRLPEPVRAATAAPAPEGTEGATAALLEIWSEILGIPVGIDDDFFELGGNSLLAVRISAALRGRGLPAVPLRDLFRTPTIRALTGAGRQA